MAEAVAHYEQREQELGEPVMREVERQVMLRIIDQKWREHLEEMDYLREGINLRAMGQKDPLTEWQREGYAMFEAMMGGVAQDFVRYAMQVQVNVSPAAGGRRPRWAPTIGARGRRCGSEAGAAPEAAAVPGPVLEGDEPRVQNLAYSAPDESADRWRPVAGAWPPAEPGDGAAASRRRRQHARGAQRLGQDAAQRAVPVRQRQEVQAVPRQVNAAGRA